MVTYRDPVGHEGVGVHDGDQLVQEVGLGVEQLRGKLLHHRFQLLSSGARRTIPRLGFSPLN